MGKDSNISWTDHTKNAWIGCNRVSEGCRNCYAESFSRQTGKKDLWGPPETTTRRLVKSFKTDPLEWNRKAEREGRRYRVFGDSMCDLFEDHPVANDYRPEVWEMYRNTPHLDWIILTKRPERIVECLPEDWGEGYPNVWLGVTIESQKHAGRAASLKKIPAVVRFISYEPALGPLKLDLTGIDWVIYGGESGSGFRPHDIQWAKDMRAACESSGTAFFYKQSPGLRPETGVDALGEVVQGFPIPRQICVDGKQHFASQTARTVPRTNR